MMGGQNKGTATYTTHLESTVELCHLLGVIPLRYPYTLLHLLCLGLHIFAHGNELVYRSLERANERLGVEGYVAHVEDSAGLKERVQHCLRPGSALDCAMSFSEM